MSIVTPRPRRLRRLGLTLVGLWLGAALAACSDDDTNGGRAGVPSAEEAASAPSVRGRLLSLTPLVALDVAQVTSYLAAFELDTSAVRFGVEAYRLEYQTLDPSGQAVRASSLLALPDATAAEPAPVTWLHGTTVYRGEAASVNEESSDRAATFFFAAAGHPTTAPDYLGLGLGDGPHPYDHLPSEVTAAIDALRASEHAGVELGRELGSRLSISGHSQGGPAAVALAREVQQGGAPGFTLASLAPISGPYDMSGSLALAARGGIAYVTAYLGYLTVAWNRWLHLYATPSEAFLPPYDRTVEQLFDNDHTVEEVFAGLPATLEEMFTPAFLARLREPTGALREALVEASRVCEWLPSVEVHVYASSADADVPIDNARHCVDGFRRNGAEVRLIDLGDADHSASMTRSLPLALAQLERARPSTVTPQP